jgi:MFS family permease
MGKKKNETNYLFKFLLLANLLQYLEAGAVPALLLSLSESFGMTPGQQGLLGGVVYLSLGVGGPFAGYLLRHHNHKFIIGVAFSANMVFALLWATTPVGLRFSTELFILLRFFMGLCQCTICVYLPLWANENAPKESRTAWMSYLQASVPLGVMLGYIIAAISISFSQTSQYCAGIRCWRWPILIEIFLLTPLYLGFYFIPSEHLEIQFQKERKFSANVSEESSVQLQLPTIDSVETTPLLGEVAAKSLKTPSKVKK